MGWKCVPLFIFCFLLGPLYGEQAPFLLSKRDLNPTLDSFFRYHFTEDHLSPELIQRSARLYLDTFDPYRAYLLEDEAKSYLNLTAAKAEHVRKQVLRGDLSFFRELNKTVQNSIRRSRKIRKELYQNLDEIWASAPPSPEASPYPKPPFAKSEAELRERLVDWVQQFIALEKSLGISPSLENPKEKTSQWFEKRARDSENPYLFLDDSGQAMTTRQEEHHLVLRSLKALAKSMDAHSSYFSPTEAYNMKVSLEKELQGIGVALQESMGGVTISYLITGGPAAKSGLIEDKDKIVAIDGQSVREMAYSKTLELIRGELGSKILLGLERHKEGEGVEFLEVELTRDHVEIQEDRVDMSYEPCQGGIIGTLTVYSFYENGKGISTEQDIRKKLDELHEIGVLKGLVIDLRNNAGGFLSQAVKTAGLFISNGVVVVSKYSNGGEKVFRDLDGYTYFDGPIILLTSKATASAAEIVAQTLQDYGVALVAGDQRTYGKGSIQHQTVTSEVAKSFFKVTVGKYYTASGKSTQVEGVQADLLVPTAFSDGKIGEEYLDYPLPYDSIDPHIQDSLSDLGLEAQRWFKKYYTPSLQQVERTWRNQLPTLQERSSQRLAGNGKYQEFIVHIQEGNVDPFLLDQEDRKEAPDYPLEEAVNIVRDMIELSQPHAFSKTP